MIGQKFFRATALAGPQGSIGILDREAIRGGKQRNIEATSEGVNRVLTVTIRFPCR